jgi:hypothetical protein
VYNIVDVCLTTLVMQVKCTFYGSVLETDVLSLDIALSAYLRQQEWTKPSFPSHGQVHDALTGVGQQTAQASSTTSEYHASTTQSFTQERLSKARPSEGTSAYTIAY